jgi:hypothetical protein
MNQGHPFRFAASRTSNSDLMVDLVSSPTYAKFFSYMRIYMRILNNLSCYYGLETEFLRFM